MKKNIEKKRKKELIFYKLPKDYLPTFGSGEAETTLGDSKPYLSNDLAILGEPLFCFHNRKGIREGRIV
jgi:hypothetical protein